ncbi:putative acyltransferase domain protein [marine gamma proteobacterium HTCC2148]|nr:putative acyltransferase domain protein [marine gamma proteobacterium HTCC2148]
MYSGPIAVLSVILFHFEVKGFSGGFLGVDIFFVISGYLITLHINEQLEQESFSFSMFYLRRVRRLFPAIFATLVLSSLVAILILPRQLLSDFAESQMAASIYVSNIYFYSVADYFDTENIVKPLLHTWSLSVEEQFYLIWPLLMYAFFRLNQTLLIVGMAVASLLAAELMFSRSPSATFYNFPFRAFEFAVGALASRVPSQTLSIWKMNVLLTLSVLSVSASIFLTTESSRNPGLNSLPLCLGVGTLIWISHPLANVKNTLTTFLVRIGLLSYSGYLVHWPLLVFFKTYYPDPLSAVEIFALLLSTYILAEVLFNTVEKPALSIKFSENRLKIFLLAPITVFFSVVFYLSHGKLYRLINPDSQGVQAILDAIPERKADLEQISQEVKGKLARNKMRKTRTIVVVGDSHALDVSLSLQYLLADTEYAVKLMSSPCDPLASESIDQSLEDLYQNHGQAEVRNPVYCEKYHDSFVSVLTGYSPDLVVFSEDWRIPALSHISGTVSQVKSQTAAEVLLLGRNPIFPPHPNILFKSIERPEEINELAWSGRYKKGQAADPQLAEIASETGSYFVSKHQLVCPSERCTMLIDGKMGYVDMGHWSSVGMKYYGKILLRTAEFKCAVSDRIP